jgi:type IV secretory pathway TrbL component
MTSTPIPGAGTVIGTPEVGTGSENGVQYTGTDTPIGYSVPVNSGSGSASNSGSGGETMLADGSYLAGLAMGGSSTTTSSAFVYSFGFFLIFFLL